MKIKKKLLLLAIGAAVSGSVTAGDPIVFNEDGAMFLVQVQSSSAPTESLKVTLNGLQSHGDFFASGKCSWNTQSYINAIIKTDGAVPMTETIEVFRTNEGSHGSGVKDHCGKHRSLIDGNMISGRKSMRAMYSSPAVRTKIEDYLKQKNTDITGFTWTVI